MKNIGQTAQLTGLSQRMLRYFEEQGLLKPRRTDAGSRLFSDEDIAEILRIRQLHTLGFTYPEIRGLLHAGPDELARQGTVLLEKQHEAALDLQDRIQQLELLCFGERRSGGPNGHRTLAEPSRTAYSLRGAAETATEFARASGLSSVDFSYWKFPCAASHLVPQCKEFSLFEFFDGSALGAALRGPAHLSAYEQAWRKAARAEFGAREIGSFPAADLADFFAPHEIVVEQRFARGEDSFHVLLPYAPLFAKLGRAERETGDLSPVPRAPVTFRPLRADSEEDCALLARWHNDPAIRHLALPHRDQEHLSRRETAEEIRAQFRKSGSPFFPVENLMVVAGERAIGTISLVIDPPHRFTQEDRVAWFGIVIGEESFRGQGVGRECLRHLEELAAKHGARVVELGVFEFNEAAQKLVRGAGYREIGRRDGTTYWRGRKWAGVHFRKRLE